MDELTARMNRLADDLTDGHAGAGPDRARGRGRQLRTRRRVTAGVAAAAAVAVVAVVPISMIGGTGVTPASAPGGLTAGPGEIVWLVEDPPKGVPARQTAPAECAVYHDSTWVIVDERAGPGKQFVALNPVPAPDYKPPVARLEIRKSPPGADEPGRPPGVALEVAPDDADVTLTDSSGLAGVISGPWAVRGAGKGNQPAGSAKATFSWRCPPDTRVTPAPGVPLGPGPLSSPRPAP
jgi:hypothetical protein